MTLRPGVTSIQNMNVDALAQDAREEGCAVYVLPAVGVVSRESFFDAIRASLPLDPPLVGSQSWDALSDSLWNGLDGVAEQRILILWPNALAMRRSAVAEYELASKVLADVAALLADPAATDGRPKELRILLG